ncbi:MAG: phosphatidate cytidylyltransferase [Chloroflexota bacterium]
MLAARVATAIVGVPIILALVWLDGPPLWIVAALAAAVAGWEAGNLLGTGRPHPLPNPSTILAIFGAAGLVLAAGIGPAADLAIIGLILFVALTLSLTRAATPPDAHDWSAALASALYAGLPLALLVSMRQWPGETPLAIPLLGTLARGTGWLLLTLTGVWAVDTAAYAVGRLVGRRRLWPRVSPNKTWEGTIGGVIAGIVVVEAWAPALGIGTGFGLGLGIALASAAVLGDLVESALKRRAQVKDAGALLPGHGGLLDRIDSLAFAAVVVFLSGILDGSAGTHVLF